MLIEDDDGFRWRCDTCGNAVTLSAAHGFWTCWGALKRRGWRAVKDDGAWWHYCRECQAHGAADIMGRVYKPSRPRAPPSIFGGPVIEVPLIEIGGA